MSSLSILSVNFLHRRRSIMQQASNLCNSQFVYVALVSTLNREEIKTKKFRQASYERKKVLIKKLSRAFQLFLMRKKSENEAFNPDNDLCPQFCATMLLSINSEFASYRQSNSKHKFAKLFLHHKIRFSRKKKKIHFRFNISFVQREGESYKFQIYPSFKSPARLITKLMMNNKNFTERVKGEQKI